MQAVKERLKQAQSAAAESNAEKKSPAFVRKFNGYKGVAAGGPKHTVRRASDKSAEAMAELASINALIKRKSEQAAAKKRELHNAPRPRSKSPAGMRVPGGRFRSPHSSPSFKRVQGSVTKGPEVSHGTVRHSSTPRPPPTEYFCPITQELMFDPVSTADGHTYERAAIKRWLSKGKRTSPLTGAVL